VTYGPALEATRARQARARGLPGSVRAALWLLALPGRQRAPWAAARALRATRLPEWCARGAGVGAPRLATLLGMLAATRPSRALPPSPAPSGAVAPAGSAAPGAARGTDAVPREDAAPGEAALLLGCVMRGLFGHVHGATVRALAANGVRVREVPDQVCCGALAAHAGDAAGAQALARRNVAAFERAPGAAIVVNSAGCGAMMKDYGHWLADDPEWAERGRAMAARVRDVSEVLAARGPKPGTRAVPLRVAYDAPCHLLHAQRVAAPPLRVLDAVPGLTLVPLEGAERCCGSAGLFALTEPAMAGDVLAAKLDAIEAAAPDVVVTGNPGCVMHIGAGLLARGHAIPVRHPVELLACSYAP
jgi:glycolate oxidase iron-sulfur subunit